MTVLKLHERYICQHRVEVIEIPQSPELVVIDEMHRIPPIRAGLFAVWDSPEVAAGQALEQAEDIIREYPSGKPWDLYEDEKQYRKWFDAVTELHTRKVVLKPDNVGQPIVVDLDDNEMACGFLPKYVNKTDFRDVWQLVQTIKCKHGDMRFPTNFIPPVSSRPASLNNGVN